MDIRVSGHQVDTGDALRGHVEARLQAVADKYFSRAHSAQVTFGKGPGDFGFACDIVAHVRQGVVLKANGSAAKDAHLAFDGAADKIEKQLRRYKKRLKDHNGGGLDAIPILDNAAYTVFNQGADADEVSDAPVIVAETRVDVPETSVSDAVMMLDLRHTNALLFKNSGSGVLNMVYRRGDGTIGWVEPHAS